MSFLSNLSSNIRAVRERDPAYRGPMDVIFSYPGFHAVLFYRMSHWLWERKLYFLGRFVSHLGRFFTAIEIHPGATIGQGFFIDHGMGVVIGETAEIGDNVTLYQGVTLGGTSLEHGKRHPTLEDDVIVGAGAQVLGPITLGKGSRVGSNAVVVKDVPANVTVTGVPARPVRAPEEKQRDFALYGTPSPDLPDPVARSLEGLLDSVESLSNRVGQLEKQLADRDNDIAALLDAQREARHAEDADQ